MKNGDPRPCRYCKKSFKPAGHTQHEKFCPSRPDHKRIIAVHSSQFKSRNYLKETLELGPTETLYGMFKDAALFGAVSHILNAQRGEDVLEELTKAKRMIDLKINSLTS